MDIERRQRNMKSKKALLIGIVSILTIVIGLIFWRMMFNHPYNNFQKNVRINKNVKELLVNTGGTDIVLNIKSGKNSQIRTQGYASVAKDGRGIVTISHNVLTMNFDTKKKNVGIIFSKRKPIVTVNVSNQQLQSLNTLKVKTNGGQITVNSAKDYPIPYHTDLNGGDVKNKAATNYISGHKLQLFSNGGSIILN